MIAPFELLEPESGETPVVVEVPHASVWLDPVSMAQSTAPVQSIARDADLYVDDLVSDAPHQGASLLIAGWSRYVLDLNRDEQDFDGLAVEGGTSRDRPCGLLWRSTTRGESALNRPVLLQELERRLELFYRPYHAALQSVVDRKRKRFGGVIVVSLHSMPGPASNRPHSAGASADVVIGTQGRSTADHRIISAVEAHVRCCGWTVSHDNPYAGGATTRRFGQPQAATHAVQVELARRLYMDEDSLIKLPRAFDLTKSFCRGLVAKIGTIALG